MDPGNCGSDVSFSSKGHSFLIELHFLQSIIGGIVCLGGRNPSAALLAAVRRLLYNSNVGLKFAAHRHTLPNLNLTSLIAWRSADEYLPQSQVCFCTPR